MNAELARPRLAGAATVRDDAPVPRQPAPRFEILGAVLLGLFLPDLDQTIVGPILPTITSDLNGVDYYTWVVTAYLLTRTVTVPIYGKLSDLFGRKPMLMIGIGLFLLGSALSGLSQEMWQLIAFRAIQGLGACALFPISLAVIGDLFTPRERGRYQGLFGAVFGIAFLVGPFLGGTLTDNFSWHWVFHVNLPIGFIALASGGSCRRFAGRRPAATSTTQAWRPSPRASSRSLSGSRTAERRLGARAACGACCSWAPPSWRSSCGSNHAPPNR